jgi:hypothetical protein
MYSIIFHIMYNIIINLKDYKNKLNKLYKDDKKIRKVKNALNKYKADLRATSENGSCS